MTHAYTVLIHRDPESGMYLVDVPDLPGVITEGETEDEARAMANEAITGFVEFLRESGLPVPESSHSTHVVTVYT